MASLIEEGEAFGVEMQVGRGIGAAIGTGWNMVVGGGVVRDGVVLTVVCAIGVDKCIADCERPPCGTAVVNVFGSSASGLITVATGCAAFRRCRRL